MFGNMKSFHMGLAESQGALQGLLHGLLPCTLPLHLLGIRLPLPCSLEGLSVPLAGWSTYRLQSDLWILSRTKSSVRDSVCLLENCACPRC